MKRPVVEYAMDANQRINWNGTFVLYGYYWHYIKLLHIQLLYTYSESKYKYTAYSYICAKISILQDVIITLINIINN